MEPVELDFIYGGNTATEGPKIVKSTEEIAAAHAKAKLDIDRHNAAIVELRKDLVGLGADYKQATKSQKSEILADIELTKKNIIDETAAVKQLKAELASLSRVKPSAAMPDANQVAKTAMGYNSLNMSVQQVVRELPAAGMGLNMFFLAISNNLPILTDNIKRARLENEALKQSNQTSTPVWKQLLGSLVSWQSALVIGITVLSIYGKQIVQWVGDLFTGEKAVKKLTASQLGLASANQIMIESLKGSEFQKAVMSINQLSTALKNAKGNHELEKKAVDDYNSSLGVTFGKVNDVDSALKLIDKNKDAYIDAMKAMSFANSFFAKSAEDAYKVMEIGLKSNAEILGKESDGYRNTINSFNEYFSSWDKKTLDVLKKKYSSTGSSGVLEFDAFMKSINKYNKEANDERSRQIAVINKHQEDSLSLAKNYYRQYTSIFNDNNFVDDQSNKRVKNKSIFGETPESKVDEMLLNINKRINDKLLKQRKDFITENQQAVKMGNDKELEELKKNRADAEKIAYELMSDVEKINKDFDERAKTLRKDGRGDLLQSIEDERNKKISAATRSRIEETKIYKMLSDEKLNISKQTTDALIADLKRKIDAEIAAGKLSKDDADKMLSDLNKAQIVVAGNKNQNNPYAQLGLAISGNTTAQKAYDIAKEDKNTPVEKLVKLEDAANKARKSIAAASAESLVGVSTILQSVVGGLDKLGILNDQQKKDAENVIGMLSGAANIAQGIATGNPVAIVQGSVELLVNALEFFDFKNKAIEKSQKQHLKNVEELEAKYKKLQRAVETALGTDIYKAQRAEIENNKKQIAEYEAWLALESQKKKKKQDANKIAETKAKIDELKNSIEDEVKAITESITQTNVKDLASELSDALVTAFQNGESAAEAMGNVVNNVLRNAVINALKLKILDKLLAPAIDQFADDMESGGELTNTEASKFKKSVTAAGELYFKALNDANDALGGIFNGDTSSSGIKGDVAKMTEETGSALTGQINAMRLNVVALLNNSKSSLNTISRVLVTLESINNNTERLNRIDETLYYIKLNGIKVL